MELWRLYCACDGTRRVTKPSEYYDLPALYVEAASVIDSEMARIKGKTTNGNS